MLLKWDENSNLFENLILSMVVLWTFVFNLLVCEPGERVTNQFEQFYAEFARCQWNNLPIDMQRLYLIFLSDTQQPIYLRTYGGVISTRETYKQVF